MGIDIWQVIEAAKTKSFLALFFYWGRVCDIASQSTLLSDLGKP